MRDIVHFLNQDVFVEAHIADIHFGVIDPLTEYKILTEQFLNYIEAMNVLDIVSVNGDIFDRKLMANSDAVMYALQFVQQLVRICAQKNATLILISGTGSHDADQLKLFIPFVTACDMRIITNQAKFIIVKGKKILCIPELYNMGGQYYNDLLHQYGPYDACYMHGTFVGAIRTKNERDLDSNREPVFDIDDFNLCKGPIISGHNHVNSVYKSHFYYCGSPIRWRFGEEGEKGFIVLLHNIRTKEYRVHLEPIHSFRYDTVNLDHMVHQDPKQIIDYINNLKANGIDYVRVRFSKPMSDTIAILKNYYMNNKFIKIDTDIEKKQVEEAISNLDSEYRKYDYLFDNNLTSQDKFVQYINQEEGSEIWTTASLVQFIQDIRNL